MGIDIASQNRYERHGTAHAEQTVKGKVHLPSKTFGEFAEFRNGVNFLVADLGEVAKIVGVADFKNRTEISVFDQLSEIRLRSTLSPDDQLQDGDLLFVRSNGSKNLVGRCVVIKNPPAGVTFSGFTIRARLDRSVVLPDYIALIFQGGGLNRQFGLAGGGNGNISNLNQAMLSSMNLELPSIELQRNIIGVASLWNAAIEKTEQLIAVHLHRKDWLVSKIIQATGSEVKLRKFLIPVSRAISKPLEPYWALGIRSHGKGTFQRYIADPSTVDMEEVYQVKCNDLIVNITFAWEGAIAFVQPDDEHCVVSHRFPTYKIDANVAHYGFVKYAVNHESFFTKLALISPGGAGRNRVLNKKDFLKLAIRLPSLEDQSSYAEVLDTAEREIALLRSQLAALKQQKRGLMQKLLTGKWRLGEHLK